MGASVIYFGTVSAVSHLLNLRSHQKKHTEVAYSVCPPSNTQVMHRLGGVDHLNIERECSLLLCRES
jgi:hypothetical protein